MATKIYALKARIDDNSIQEIGLYSSKKEAIDHFNWFVKESKDHLKWNEAIWVQTYVKILNCYEPILEYAAIWERV